MPSDVTVDSDSDSHSENDTDNNNQGRKSWGDGGDIYPPCFDMGGITCLLSPPCFDPQICWFFLFWKINNVL